MATPPRSAGAFRHRQARGPETGGRPRKTHLGDSVAETIAATTRAPVVREWSLTYNTVPGAVRLARLRARRELTTQGWAGDIDTAVLVLSELLANAVQHASRPGQLAEVRLAVREDDALVIDVTDPMPAFPNFHELTAVGPEAVRGRGICLTRALGAHITWHLLSDGSGKTVRADLPA